MTNEKNIPPSLAEFAVAERAELLARIEEQAREIERLECIVDKAWNRSHSIEPGACIPGALDAWKRPVLQFLPYDFSGNPGTSATQYCNGWNDAGGYWKAHADDLSSELAALKAQPSGVVLPEPLEMRPFQTVDQGSTNFKAGFNAALRKVLESIKSPTVSDVDDMCNANNPETRCVCREEFGHRVCVSAGVADERAAFESWLSVRGVWPRLTYEEVFIAGIRTAQPDHSAPDGLRISAEDVEHLKHACRELTRMDRAPLYIRQALAQKVSNMLAASPTPGKEIE